MPPIVPADIAVPPFCLPNDDSLTAGSSGRSFLAVPPYTCANIDTLAAERLRTVAYKGGLTEKVGV